MFCRKCGAVLRPDDVFCSKCGIFVVPGKKPVDAVPVEDDSVLDISKISPEDVAPVNDHSYDMPKPKKNKNNKGTITTLCIMGGAVLISVIVILVCLFSGDKVATADKYFADGEYEKAAKAYERILEDNEKNTTVRVKLAKAYMELEDYNDAIDVLDAALKYQKGTKDIYQLLLVACGEAKDHDLAAEYYEEARDSKISVDLEDTGYFVIPDLVELSLSSAENIEDINVVENERVDDESDVDTILEQKPAAGSLAWGNDGLVTVKVKVSDGPGKIIVSDYEGKTIDAVEYDLEDDYTIVKVEQSSAEVDTGLIIRTEPSVGEVLEKDGTITVYISTGVKYVIVPKLADKSLEDAKATLAGLGLEVGDITYESDSKSSGTVLRHSPAQKSEVSEGTKIDIVVAK